MFTLLTLRGRGRDGGGGGAVEAAVDGGCCSALQKVTFQSLNGHQSAHFAHNSTGLYSAFCLQIVQKVNNMENCMGRNALHGPLRYHLALCVGR